MSTNLLKSLSASQLRRAAAIRAKIDKLESQLNQIVSGTAPAAPRRGGRRFSAATRAKMAAAQKARWAKLKAGKK